jgi:hypothetical protein
VPINSYEKYHIISCHWLDGALLVVMANPVQNSNAGRYKVLKRTLEATKDEERKWHCDRS